MARMFLVLFALTALLSGCSKEFEKYITSHRGVIIVYGKNFAFTTFKPEGWYSDKMMVASNDISLYIRPTNRTETVIYSLGVVLTNTSGLHSNLANSLAETAFARDIIADRQVEVVKTTNTYQVDRAREVYTYSVFNDRKTKGLYEDLVFVVWDRAIVMIALKAGSPAELEKGRPVLAQFISGIKYWGHNSDELANRVVRLFFKPQK